MGKKIEWLAVVQGLGMLLVVIGHVSLTNVPGDPSTPIATAIEQTVYTFHMPLFIFISGWLFFHTCIAQGRPYKAMLKSKAKRLVVPLLAFTVATMLLKLAFPQLMHRPVDWQEVVNTFVLLSSNPLGEMWFIEVLFELMLLYPAYKLMTSSKAAAAVGLAIAVLLNLFTPADVTVFQLSNVAHMMPYFVAGILCCRYGWHRHLDHGWALAVTALAFVACNVLRLLPQWLDIVTASAGIAFSFALCQALAKRWPQLFGSFRDYTFQIFLMGIFFQMSIRWLYVKTGQLEMLFVPLWLLSVAIGVYAPTLIAKVIDRHAPRGIKMCFGL